MATTRATHKSEIKAIIDSIGLSGVTVTSTRKSVYDTTYTVLIDSGSMQIERVDTQTDLYTMAYNIHVIAALNDSEAEQNASIDRVDVIVLDIVKKMRETASQDTQYWIDSNLTVSALHNGEKIGLSDNMLVQTITVSIQQEESH